MKRLTVPRHTLRRRHARAFFGVSLLLALAAAVLTQLTPARALTAPTITSVSPGSGSVYGGDTITLVGSGLTTTSTVKVGDSYASNVIVLNDTTLTFTSPVRENAHSVDVTVTDSSGQQATLANSFTYIYPTMTITGVSPASGPVNGAQTVTITGQYFSPGFREVSQISSGDDHTCGIYDGRVYCWGNNTFGQLGDGTRTKSSTPVAVDTSGVLAGKTIISVSADYNRTCALTSDGQVYCWGQNDYGQLGNNSKTNSYVPVAVYTSGALVGKSVKQISVGQRHTCVVASDDQAYCWGSNNYGQLGNNTTTDSSVPVAVNRSGAFASKTIKRIVAGTDETCAIASDSQVYCWGWGLYGQLGNNSTANSSVPVAVDTTGVLNTKAIVSIAVGPYNVCAVDSNGQSYCWGSNNYGQLGNGSNTSSRVPVAVDTTGSLNGIALQSVTANGLHVCALSVDNQAFCWGYNAYGQLGNNSTAASNYPQPVTSSNLPSANSIETLSAGYNHTCATAFNHQTYCWGYNSYGQVGNNDTANVSVPVASSPVVIQKMTVAFRGVDAPKVTYVSPNELTVTTPAQTAGLADITATRYDNTTATLSSSYTYQAAPSVSSLAPARGSVAGGDTITVTGADFRTGLKIKVDGIYVNSVTVIDSSTATFVTPASVYPQTVNIELEDEYGQTVLLDSGYRYILPSQPSITEVVPSSGSIDGGNSVAIKGAGFANAGDIALNVSTSGTSTCAIYITKTAYCWGRNNYGQLGTGSYANATTPAAIDTLGALQGKVITAIKAGNSQSCAATDEGKIYCWGYNYYGGLGNNTTTSTNTPTPVTNIGFQTSPQTFSIGSLHSCAISTNGYAYCWGLNNTGQLGAGNTYDYHTPVTTGGATYKSISAGGSHTCAVSISSQAYCWGLNSSGQLGNNSTTQATSAVAVSASGVLNGKQITGISAGANHSCATTSDGKVFCWGYNGYGQLGNGSTANSNVPVAVTMTGALAGKSVTSVDAGSDHTCVVTSDKQIFCWGLNTSGQLGNSSTANSSVPVAVTMTGALAGKSIAAVEAGTATTCVTTTDSQIYCWGQNSYGQLGSGTADPSLAPQRALSPNIAPAISIGNIPATNVQFVSSTELTATAPAHAAGLADVTVTDFDTQSTTAAQAYEYVAPPSATSLSPTAGLMTGGDTVTVTGTNFNGNLKVNVNGIASPSVTLVNSTTLTFVTPASLTPGTFDVIIEDEFGAKATLTNSFTYRMADPVLDSISPQVGPMGGGTMVTIKGSGFIAKSGGGTWYSVLFNGKPAISTVYVDNQTLQAFTPSSTTGTSDVTVTSDYTNPVTLDGAFTYLAQKFVFSNAPLDVAIDQSGMLTIEARNSIGTPITSPVDVTIDLTTDSSTGSFARNLSEDAATRWSYTSVVLPAGSSSVNVWYKDTTPNTPTITGTIEGDMAFTQQETFTSPFRFVVSGVSDPIQAGQPSSMTVRVVDRNGLQRTDYTGTIHFTSSDPVASLPPNYTMKSSDYGIKTFTNGVTMGSTGEYCISATDTSDATIVGQQCGVSVQPANVGTISQLALTTPAQRVTTSHYSSPITIQTQDTSGKFISVTADTSVYLYSDSSTGEFSLDGATWSSSEPFEAIIPAGASSINVYFRDPTARTTLLSARDLTADTGDGTTGDHGWQNATQSIVTGVSPPTKLRISGDQALISGDEGTYVVQLLDDAGNLVNATNDITLRVDSDTSTTRFYDPAATGTATAGPFEFRIPSGATGTTIGVSDSTLSTSTNFTTLTFTDGRPDTETARLQDGTFDIQVVQAFPAAIRTTAASSTVQAGVPVAVDVALFDATSQPAFATQQTVVTLSSTLGGEFSLTDSPFTPITSFEFQQGEGSRTVYYRNTLAGTTDLSASAADMSSQADTIDVTAAGVTRLGLTSPSNSAPLNMSSSTLTVTMYDLYGNVTSENTDRTVYLYSDQTSTSFAMSTNGPWSASAITIPAGFSSAQFFAKDTSFHQNAINLTVSDAPTLDSPDTNITNGTTSLSIISQPVDSIVVSSAPQTIVAGEPSGQIIFELRQADGSPAIQDGSTKLNVTADHGTFIASADVGAAIVSSIVVSRGASSATGYFMDTQAGIDTLTATFGATAVQATQSMTITSAAATTLGFASLPQSIDPETTSGAIRLSFYDQFGNIAALSAPATLQLQSSCTTGSFSLSDTTWKEVNSVDVASGVDGVSFFYKDTMPAHCTLTATIDGFDQATQSITVKSFAVDHLVITTAAPSIAAGEVSNMMTVELKRANGSPAYQNGSSRLELAVESGTFLRDQRADSQPVSLLQIPAGEAAASFYYTGTKAGNFTATVQLEGGGQTAAQAITVTPLAASALAFTTVAQTIPAGSPSSAIRVAVRDTYGNLVGLAADTTFALTSSCVDGSFSEDMLDWQAISSIVGGKGASDVTFYYKATAIQDCAISIAAPDFTKTSQSLHVTTSSFPTRLQLAAPSTPLTKGESRQLAVSLYDDYGNVTPASTATTVYLSGDSPDGHFSSPSITFLPGVSTIWTSYTNNTAGTVTVTARDQIATSDTSGSLTDDSQTLTYVDGAPASILLAGSSTAEVGEVTDMQVSFVNAFDQPVAAASDTTITLTSSVNSGVFQSMSGDSITTILLPKNSLSTTVRYRQTASSTATIQAAAPNLQHGELALNVFSQDKLFEMRFMNQPYVTQNSLEAGNSATYRVGLYDEFGNVTTDANDITLYTATTGDGTLSSRQLTIPAGNSLGSFSYSQTTTGNYTITVSDSNTQTPGILGAISQNGEVVKSKPRSFTFSTDAITLERGAITQAITVTLVDVNGIPMPAVSGGQTIALSMQAGSGSFATTKNGQFTTSLPLVIPVGKTTATFYYRNDTGNAGLQTIQGGSTFAGSFVSKNIAVSLTYGDPTQLAFMTGEYTIPAGDPSPMMTIEQQNQYGTPVPAAEDTVLHLSSSNASTSQFGSSKTSWGVNSVTIPKGMAGVNFYYQDTTQGTATITVSDTLPLTPDIGLVNTSQQVYISPAPAEPRVVDNFLVTNISDPQAQGTGSSVIVIARDSDGYVVDTYDGTIAFSSDDANAQLPEPYTFSPRTDKGVKVFTNQVAFSSLGEQTVSVSSDSGAMGRQAAITVLGGNAAPVTAVTITQPTSTITLAPNTPSPNITLELHDADGKPTNAPLAGMPIHLTSTSATGEFALSANGPWQQTLTTTIQAGFSYANVYYRDSAVGEATITAADWTNSADNQLIANSTLGVQIHTIYAKGSTAIETQNAFGAFEPSTYLFAHDSSGSIAGRVTSTFSAHRRIDDGRVASPWQSQWRQGVNLLKTDSADQQDSYQFTIPAITTHAGANDFYAIAEATESTFADPFSVVSKQLHIPVSPWQTAIETEPFVLLSDGITITTHFSNNTTLSASDIVTTQSLVTPNTMIAQLLTASATDASQPIYTVGAVKPSNTMAITIPTSLTTIGERYKLFVVTYDENGNTTSQALSRPFTVLAMAPTEPPATTTTNTPLEPASRTTPDATPPHPVESPTTPKSDTETTPSPDTKPQPVVDEPQSIVETSAAVATYGASIIVVLLLLGKAYKKVVRTRKK